MNHRLTEERRLLGHLGGKEARENGWSFQVWNEDRGLGPLESVVKGLKETRVRTSKGAEWSWVRSSAVRAAKDGRVDQLRGWVQLGRGHHAGGRSPVSTVRTSLQTNLPLSTCARSLLSWLLG